MLKMKKFLASILALAMVLGMTLAVSAEESTNIPEATDTATATVENVEAGAEVTAYQIVKGRYNDYGFLGYEKTNASLNIGDVKAPTAEEVTEIARAINDSSITFKTEEVKTMTASGSTYTAELGAGYWIVLVRGTVNVYNPMIIGMHYYTADDEGNPTSSGSNAILQDANMSDEVWDTTKLAGQDAYAKMSNIDIDKKITSSEKKTDIVGDVAYGDTISFEITTTVPDYSEEFTSAVFKITDTLDNGLDLDAETIVVTVTGAKEAPEKDTDYTVTSSEHGFVVEFASEWLLKNGTAAVKVVYSAEVNDKATTNFVPNKNEAYLTYTNNPGETEDTEKEITRHYTFEIDGAVNGTNSEVTEEILKMGTQIINGEEVTAALSGAKFAIRKAGTTDVIAYATSDKEGLLNFKGLDADVDYEIYEVEAPNGWTINETIYTARITATYNNDGTLQKYEVKITNNKDEKEATSIHEEKVLEEVKTIVVGNATTDIPNTKLVNLPSTGGIGTTIFTVAGCAIMIVAAFFFFANRRKENN